MATDDRHNEKGHSRPENEQKAFGENLAKVRAAVGMSQRHLSDAAGISEAQIWAIERGQWDPKVSTVRALARGLRTAPIELVSDPVLRALMFPESLQQVSQVDSDLPP